MTDPFALPSATASRFALLMVTAGAGTTVLTYLVLGGVLSQMPDNPIDGRQGCFEELVRDVEAGSVAGLDFYACNRAATIRFALAVVGAVVLLAVLTFAGYRWYPRLIERRQPSRPLSAFTACPPEVLELVERMRPLAGRPVEVRVAVNRPTAGGRAFGRRGRYRIVLDAGLLVRAAADPTRLRAVFAHELAHVRNRDVDITYLAMAVWWAFILISVVPFLIAGMWYTRAMPFIGSRVAFLLALVWLARAAVLRTREFYADLRVTEQADDLRTVLAQEATREHRRRLPSGLRYHPAAARRLAMLDDPSPLLRVLVLDCFIVGALVGLAFSPIYWLTETLFDSLVWQTLLTGGLFSVLIAGSVGGSVWRQTYHRLAAGRPPEGVLAGSVALATGVIAGQLAAPPMPGVNNLIALVVNLPLQMLVVVAALYPLCYCALRWIALTAAGWLPVSRSRRTTYHVGVVVAGAVLGTWLTLWFRFQGHLMSADEVWQMMAMIVFSLAVDRVTQASVVLLLLYPALAWAYARFRRREGDPAQAVVMSVPLAYLYAGALMVAVSVVPFAVQDRILAANQPGAPPWLFLSGLTVVLAVIAATAVPAGLALGLWRGGRGRTPLSVLSAALGALLVTPYLVAASYVHFMLAMCEWDLIAGCLRETPASSVLGSGSLLSIWFTGAAVAAVLGAACGSLVRAGIQRARRTARPVLAGSPGRQPVRAAVALIPAVLVTAVFCALVLRPNDPGTGSTNLRTVAGEQRFPAPNSWTHRDACVGIARTWRQVSTNDIRGSGMDVRYTEEVALGIGSNDRGLAKLSTELHEAMTAGDSGRAGKTAQALSYYCGLTV